MKDHDEKRPEHYLQLAVAEARKGMSEKEGGPFGAVIVQNGRVIARGHNRVLATNDPTAHSEIVAIREATRSLGTYDLSGCVMYSSCEPCPMCFSAIHWARIDRVYYGAGRDDAARIGFDDKLLYDMLSGRAEKSIPEMVYTPDKGCVDIIDDYVTAEDGVIY